MIYSASGKPSVKPKMGMSNAPLGELGKATPAMNRLDVIERRLDALDDIRMRLDAIENLLGMKGHTDGCRMGNDV